MAELSAIKLPNNTTFTFKDVEARGTTELIVGTQTAATGAWTGNASFSTLEDGRSILYWLPYAGSGNATLNLTLSDNTTTGAINCYYGGTSRLTTHYGAGNVIRLTYRENVSIAGSDTLYTGWWAEGNYDTNTIVTADLYINAKTGAQGIWNVSLVMRDGTGCYQNVCTAANGTATSSNRTTATTKKANTNGFEIYSPIWYSAGNYDANSNIAGINILYDNYGLFDARYSFNVTRAANQLLTYKPIFLVGTINSSNGLFYLDSTWWTQTATDTSKVYILVGGCYDSTTNNIRINLNLENTWYKYDGTRLVPMQSLDGDVTLTGDITGSGSTGGSITTTLANSGVTAGSYGPSANVALSSGSGSFSVPYFTVDSKGRVTAASTKTVTITLPIYNGSVT